MMIKKIKFTPGLLLVLAITFAISFCTARQAQAQVFAPQPVMEVGHHGWLMDLLTGSNTASTLSNTGLHVADIAKAVAQQLVSAGERQLLAQMTQDMVNWINTGFHGSPLFVQNPDSFFRDIGKLEIKNIVDRYGYDSNLYPFGKSFALNVINSYKNTAANDAAYSLSKVINDPNLLNNYRNNFNTGGWNGFLINTQYPQNNYLGFQMLATDELARQLAGTTQNTAQKVQTTLQQGMGFLSPKTCPSNPAYNANVINEFKPPTYTPPTDSEVARLYKLVAPVAIYPPGQYPFTPGAVPTNQAQLDEYQTQLDAARAAMKDDWSSTNTCPGGLVATTPGSVVGNRIMTALNSDFQQTVLGGLITNSISALTDALANHFIGKGLTELKNVANPPPSSDNWSYNGLTLDNGSTIDTMGSTQNVSISAGGTSNVTLTGGTTPYTISTQPDSTVATAKISTTDPNILVIKGAAPGTTSVILKDSSTPAKITTVQILITSSVTSAIDFDTETPLDIVIDTDKTATLTMTGGTPDYVVSTQADPAVAVANTFGNTLMIGAIGAGTTTIVVQDTSIPARTVIIQITIGNQSVSPLSVTPKSISINADAAGKIITISGGNPPYAIYTNSDSSIAQTVPNGDNTFTVVGVAAGSTSVTIKDSSAPTQTTPSIPITVTSAQPQNFTADLNNPFSAPSVSLAPGGGATVTLSGGNGSYQISSPSNPNIAQTSVSGNTLTITSVAAGSTSVTVWDMISHAITIPINVTANPLSSSVTPNISTSTNPNLASAPPITAPNGTGPYYWGGTLNNISSDNIIAKAKSLADSLQAKTIRIALSPTVDINDKGGSCIPNFTLAGIAARADFKSILSDPQFNPIVITAYDGVTLGDCVTNRAIDPTFYTADNTAKIQTEYRA